jgi:azurin
MKRIAQMRLMFAFGLLALSAAPALAGTAEAQSCAGSLDANSQLIFNTALPQVAPGADLKGVVTNVTKSLVKSGQISRGDARPAAMSAGECLKLAMK